MDLLGLGGVYVEYSLFALDIAHCLQIKYFSDTAIEYFLTMCNRISFS